MFKTFEQYHLKRRFTMSISYASLIQPPTSVDAMSYYTGTLAKTTGDLQLQIQNRIEPSSAPPISVKLWVGGQNMGKQILYHGNMWGDPNPLPMVRDGALIKIKVEWKKQSPDPIIFRAHNKPENVSIFNAGGKLRIVHNGAVV
jgi:hypothetical protein